MILFIWTGCGCLISTSFSVLWVGKICPEVPLTSKAAIWPITGGTGLVPKVPTVRYDVSEGKYCVGLGERKRSNKMVGDGRPLTTT